MNSLSGTNAIWAGVVILVIPTLIIAAAELGERLRQRESPFRPAVRILRTWALPFFALWALLVPVLGVDRESLLVRATATGLLVAVTAAVLSVLRVALAAIRNRPRGDDRRSVPQLVLALPRIGVFLVAGWILLAGVWGVDLSSALAALGVTSLVVSFALQDTLSGLASGVLLVSDQPFKPGDWVRLGEGETALVARVVDLNWRTTRVVDRNGDLIVIPNAQLAGSPIVNHSAPESLHRVQVNLQVAYANPPTLAKAMLLDAATGTPLVKSEPAPDVKVVKIDDPLMEYQVQMWIDDYADEPQVKSDFGSLVWYQSNRHGVPLPSPAQDLYLYDGVDTNEAQIPTLAEVRTLLLGSPLLGSLGEGDLDRLARSSRPARFAVGELIIAPTEASRDLIVVVEGRAEFLLGRGAEQMVSAEVGEGEVIGLVRTSRRDRYDISVRAVTDCEVVVVDADEAGEIASRNAELATALNQVASVRRRRMERLAGRGAVVQLEQPEGEET